MSRRVAATYAFVVLFMWGIRRYFHYEVAPYGLAWLFGLIAGALSLQFARVRGPDLGLLLAIHTILAVCLLGLYQLSPTNAVLYGALVGVLCGIAVGLANAFDDEKK